MTYAQKLLDPRWQRKKNGILDRDDYTCQKCGSKEKTLHVHHKIYIYGNSPWDYDDVFLETLCLDCHKEEHLSEQEVAAREDAKTNIEEWTRCHPFIARVKDVIPVMKIKGVYEAHCAALSKIRKEISERNKPIENV